ncbi:uncharacterized protein KIAA1143 homolog [Electrophorus electricus]|uniref:uncharacterized protein KIAA1143 homolog n=1 Tax=Electrophorus electricus TaxID=8005 RepID=UPI0015CFEA4A|nr:uncharacterized protein KIAA1143 homolog [Electrophorus electricus]
MEREQMPERADDSGDSDRQDERPQVVVLKEGDLSAEEVMQIKKEINVGKKDEQPQADGKIIFKKPIKCSFDKFGGITASSDKRKKSEITEKKKAGSGVKVQNKSLLSFGGGDDDEDE